MGKLPLVTVFSESVAVAAERQQRPSNLGLGSILTADEYRSAVIALVKRVGDDDSNDKETMQGLSAALRRLLMARYDPPLPLYWTLISVEKSLWLDRTNMDPLDFGTSISNFASRELRLLKSLSAVNASGNAALSSVAPIVGLLYDVSSLISSAVGPLDEIQEKSGKVGGSGKKARKLVRKLKELIGNLLSFASLCHCKDLKTFEQSSSLPPAPSVPVDNFPDVIHSRLPLASKKSKSRSMDLSNSAVLAGIVFGDAVILQLVVETLERRIALKKQNSDFSVGHDVFLQRLKNLAVHSVWAASSTSPSETLLDLLLEKRLPVLDILAANEEILVRGVLYEVVLIDTPLFSLFGEPIGESNSSLSSLDQTSVLFMKKLSIARRALALLRSQQERGRVASLLTKITAWHVPPRLSKWVKSQNKQRLPIIALQDDQALINWFVTTAEKSVFKALLEKIVAGLSSGLADVDTAQHVEVLEVENGRARFDGEGEDLFFVDTAPKKEVAATDPSAADVDFAAAAQAIKGESGNIKQKKTHSKVLFHRHEQSSAGTKRFRTEFDDRHLTSSSGSDSENSRENPTQSLKKLKHSKLKVNDGSASSEEGEHDDDDRLTSAHLSREEISSSMKPGDFITPDQAEYYPAQRIEELPGEGVEITGGVEPTEALLQPDKETVVSSVSASEVDAINSSITVEVGPVALTERKSAKKKKTMYFEDLDVEAERCPPQTTKELTLTVGSEELLLQPDLETVVSSAIENGIGKLLTKSPLEPALPGSHGKSAKKKKKKSKNSGDPDIEAGVELVRLKRTEELALGVGTNELLAQPDEERVMTSVSAVEVDTEMLSTISPEERVLQTEEKSAKKKKVKAKDLGDLDMETTAELHSSHRSEEPTGGLLRTEGLVGQTNEAIVNPSVSAGEVGTEDSLTTAQVNVVPLSLAKSPNRRKKSRNPEVPVVEVPADVVGGSNDESLLTTFKKSIDGDAEADIAGNYDGVVQESIVVSKTIQDVDKRASIRREKVEDVAQVATTTSYEETETRRTLFPSLSRTPQNEVADDVRGTKVITRSVVSSSVRNLQEEIQVVKSSKKKRRNEFRREGDEGNQCQIFDTIKEELVTASAILSSADLIDALQVEKSLPVAQQMTSKTKTTRSKRVRLGEESNNTAGVVATETTEIPVAVSVLDSENTRSAFETTEGGKVCLGDASTTEEEARLSASVAKEILGNGQIEIAEGRSHDVSEKNKTVFSQISPRRKDRSQDTARPPVESTISPMKNLVEDSDVVKQVTPSKKNSGGTGTPRSRKKRVKSQTDVGLPTVPEDGVQPQEVCEENPLEYPPKTLEGEDVQEAPEVTTPVAQVQASINEAVSSIKPFSTKRKVKPELSQLSGGSDTSIDVSYQRRTRSGRALGTPPPTPTRKANMRRKLVLEAPLEEEN